MILLLFASTSKLKGVQTTPKGNKDTTNRRHTSHNTGNPVTRQMFYSPNISTQPQDHSIIGTGLLPSQSYDEQTETIHSQSKFEQETIFEDLTSLPSTEVTETESTLTITTSSLVVDRDFSSAFLPIFKEISPFSSIKSTTSIMQYGSKPTSLSSCVGENYINSIILSSAKGSAHYSIVTGYHSDRTVSSRKGFLASKTKDISLISEKSLDYKSSGTTTPSLTRIPVMTSSMLVQNTKSTVTLSTMEEQPMIADTAQRNHPSLVQTLQYLFSQNMIDVETLSSWYGNNVAAETRHNDANFLTVSTSWPEAYSDISPELSIHHDSVAPEFKITAISHLMINQSDMSHSLVGKHFYTLRFGM